MPAKVRVGRFILPTLEEDRAITAAALADPDCPPLTDDQIARMVPLKTFLGRPRSPNKKLLLSIRYSPQVVKYFRSTGPGWQTRMDGVLRRYVARQTKAG
jgi:uncharacterized protein (DUF4415 family)